LVKVARKARTNHPSAGTLAMLMETLETRAVLRLMKTNTVFANAVVKQGRLIDLSTLLVIHMDEDPEFRRAALTDPDLLEVMALLRDRDHRYPSRVSTWAWLLFRHADAPYAQLLSERVRGDLSYAAHFQLKSVFEPRTVDAVVAQYHYALALGDRKKAQQVLDDARKANVDLPELLGRQLKS
jgi:hypothetical protein